MEEGFVNPYIWKRKVVKALKDDPSVIRMTWLVPVQAMVAPAKISEQVRTP